jgi:hypothetical protein
MKITGVGVIPITHCILLTRAIKSEAKQTIKRKSGQKSSATTSSGQSEEARDFEAKPTKRKS